MASFSIDKTDITYAGGRTGYETVNITNAPSGGIRIIDNGFGIYFRVNTVTAQSYEIQTKGTNTSGNTRISSVRFANVDDDNDYVDVTVTQYSVSTIAMYGEDIFSAGGTSYDLTVPYDKQGLYVYVDVVNPEDSMTVSITGGSWLSDGGSFIASTTTGFKYGYISFYENTGTSSRTGTVTFTNGSNTATLLVTQNAVSPGQMVVSPTSLTFPKTGGSDTFTLAYGGQYSFDNSEVSSWVSMVMTNVSEGLATGVVTAPESDFYGSYRTGNVYFSDTNGGMATLALYQAPQYDGMSLNPSNLLFPAEGGSRTTDVTYYGILSWDSFPSWLSASYSQITSSSREYTITAASNTSTSARSVNLGVSDGYDSKTLVVTQNGVDPSLTISPTQQTVDSSSGTFTVSVSSAGLDSVNYVSNVGWITFVSVSGNDYTFSYSANNTTSDRTGTITFYSGTKQAVFTLNQEGQAAPYISVTPSSSNVDYTAGSTRVTLSSENVSAVTVSTSYNWISCYPEGSSRVYYTVAYSANTSSSPRTGTVNFTGTGSATISTAYTLNQQGAPAPIMGITPSSDNVTSAAGEVSVALRTQNIDTVGCSVLDSWIHNNGESGGTYTFGYDANTGLSSRTGTVRFTGTGPGGTINKDYTLTQEGTAPIPTLVISPTNEAINNNSRLVRVTVVTNQDNVTYNISDSSWLHFSSIIPPNNYSFICDANTGTSSRTNTVTFSAGSLTATYTLIQEGTTPVVRRDRMKSVTDNLRFYSEGDTVTVNFINKPSNMSNSVIYTDGSGWLTVTDQTVVCSANTGIARKAVIRFYDLEDITNYADIPVIQGSSTYWESIWVDDIFTPSETEDYHYSIYISNPHFNGYFEGLTPIPQEGININRLVDDYIYSELIQTEINNWESMYKGYCIATLYDITQDTQELETTHYLWNDWSGKEKRYDYTRSLNDPINGKGCKGMIIPFCVYKDTNDSKVFSIVQIDEDGDSTRLDLADPLEPFNMMTDTYYDISKVSYLLDDEVLFSYDMNHCGGGAFIYRNRFGGWDSFLIEGNISRTDNYGKLNYRTKDILHHNEKRTDSVDIDCTYEAYTGWLSDEEAERLTFHLASSPKVYFQDLNHPDEEIIPVRMTLANAEYKKFRNGKTLVNYTITFEKGYTEKVKD